MQQCVFGTLLSCLLPSYLLAFVPVSSTDWSQGFLGGQYKAAFTVHLSDKYVPPKMCVLHLGPSCAALISQSLLSWAQYWKLGVRLLLILQTSTCLPQEVVVCRSGGHYFLSRIYGASGIAKVTVKSRSDPPVCTVSKPWIFMDARSMGEYRS